MSEPSAYDPIQYWSELLGERYDDTGVAYPALSESFNQALHRALTRETRRVLDRYGLLDRSPSRVLDVGSGSGIWIRFWTEFGARQIVGVDLTEVAVERLRMRHPQATFLQADVGEPGLSVGGMFDFISAMSVLLRVVDDSRWRRALRNLATVLAPDGHLVVFDPVIVSRRGAERWYRSLAERLAASGHEVTVLTLRQWEPDEEADFPGVRVVTAGPRMALYANGPTSHAAAAQVRARRARASPPAREGVRRRAHGVVSVLLAARGGGPCAAGAGTASSSTGTRHGA